MPERPTNVVLRVPTLDRPRGALARSGRLATKDRHRVVPVMTRIATRERPVRLEKMATVRPLVARVRRVVLRLERWDLHVVPVMTRIATRERPVRLERTATKQRLGARARLVVLRLARLDNRAAPAIPRIATRESPVRIEKKATMRPLVDPTQLDLRRRAQNARLGTEFRHPFRPSS